MSALGPDLLPPWELRCVLGMGGRVQTEESDYYSKSRFRGS